MLTMAIPEVEILAVCLCSLARSFAIYFQFICQTAPTFVAQVVESLRGQGQCRGLKVVKSCPNGHFLFTSSDTSAVRCIV